jgi:hypothetical protein
MENVMRVVPRNLVPQIEFCERHLAGWLAHAEEIGTSSETVAALAELAANARAAYLTQQTKQLAARAATVNCDLAIGEMEKATRAIILQVRAKASADGDGVYSLASISSPAAPSPVGPPGTPSQFAAKLNGDGSLLLSWKCKNPPNAKGTMYEISRRIGTGKFEPMGVVGKKKFVDNTLPKGSAKVTYQIRAVRSTRTGDAAQFNVAFGGTGVRKSVALQVSRRAA